jgi:hypothetical protein
MEQSTSRLSGETPLLDVKTMSLWSERIVIALPDGHRLTTGETAHSADPRGETLFMTRHDPAPAIHELLATSSAARDGRPRIVQLM